MTTMLKEKPLTQDVKTDIPNTPSVVEALSEALTNTYRLVVKSHSYHWNVTGPMFVSIHNLAEAQYTDMFGAADVIAERIRALGKPAALNFAELGENRPGKGLTDGLSAEQMIKDLLTDHEDMARDLRSLVELAEAEKDPVTADLATDRAGFHEKAAWMLRSMAA